MASKNEPARKDWSRPRLVRLGKLADVAPGTPGVAEGNSGKS